MTLFAYVHPATAHVIPEKYPALLDEEKYEVVETSEQPIGFILLKTHKDDEETLREQLFKDFG